MAEGPPRIDPDKLDFSQFHPIDHYWFEPRCKELYGKRRIHFKYAWEFIHLPRLKSWTLCKVGRHNYVQWWRHEQPLFEACSYCSKKKG